MKKIMIVDTLYPEFLNSLPFDVNSSYHIELRKVMDRKFGTSDFFSRGLRQQGWHTMDIIANHMGLQQMWAESNLAGRGLRGSNILDLQIEFYAPDVIFMQDLSVSLPDGNWLLAGQCSCALPSEDLLRRYAMIFTSLPGHVEHFRSIGVGAEYLPLAFDSSVMDGGLGLAKHRAFDVSFVGGVGVHWREGMDVLETVARQVPTFKWWGYGAEQLPAGALRFAYQGEAWGLDMYRVLAQSKIVLNRHGEIAAGFANNLRMYEATGCGAMLLTDNYTTHFEDDEKVFYEGGLDAVSKIQYYLAHDEERRRVAWQGQSRTLRDHAYSHRMAKVSEVLKGMLCPV